MNQMDQKKNRGEALVIASIIVAFITIAVIVVILVIKIAHKYSPGVVDGTSYVNKWADVKIDVPDSYQIQQVGGMSNGFETPFAFFRNSPVAAGIVVTREGETDMYKIEEEFLQEFGGSGGSISVPMGKTVQQMSIDQTHRTIAGEDYLCFEFSSQETYMCAAFRAVHDNGVFGIVAVATSADEIDEVLNLLEKN
ncbi:MAG: hypothetical protein IJM57_03985 [Lachnospiraceae bacterium]|nr:hypothetical protein [Lachnospiraceae bacterium]